MPVTRILKRPGESKNYTFDYSNWLDTGEMITSVSTTVDPVTTPALSVNAQVATGATSVVLSASSGLASQFYSVVMKVFTNSAPVQEKEDCVEFNVEDYC